MRARLVQKNEAGSSKHGASRSRSRWSGSARQALHALFALINICASGNCSCSSWPSLSFLAAEMYRSTRELLAPPTTPQAQGNARCAENRDCSVGMVTVRGLRYQSIRPALQRAWPHLRTERASDPTTHEHPPGPLAHSHLLPRPSVTLPQGEMHCRTAGVRVLSTRTNKRHAVAHTRALWGRPRTSTTHGV